MNKRELILAQIIGGSLDTIADEMSATVTRTARSPVFNEAHDFTTGIFEMKGLKSRLVAQSPGCTLHLYAIAMAVDRAIDAFKFDLQPGDVILASDPYDGGTHIPDLIIVMPVFHDRKRSSSPPCARIWGMSAGRLPAATIRRPATSGRTA